MVIIIVRHAEALDRKIAAKKRITDRSRGLTTEGIAAFQSFIKGKKKLFQDADQLISSSLLRARQTAQLIKESYLKKIAISRSSLIAPDANPKKFIHFIKTTSAKKLIFVSHEPFIGDLLFELIGAKMGSIKMKKGGIIVFVGKNNKITLNQFMNPP